MLPSGYIGFSTVWRFLSRQFFAAAAADVRNLINGMSPSPAAFCSFKGQPLNFYRAFLCEGEGGACGQVLSVTKQGIVIRCGDGCVRVTGAQFAGGKRLSAADIVNGRKLSVGDILE